MKHLKVALLLFVAALTFQSCKDDEKKANQFNYDSKNYAISTLLVARNSSGEKNTDGDSVYVHFAFLLGPGMTFTGSSLSATSGDIVVLGLISNTSKGLQSGTYDVPDGAGESSPFDMVGGLLLGYNTQTGTGTFTGEIETGSLKLSISGQKYTLDGEVKLENEKLVKIHYSGNVQIIED